MAEAVVALLASPAGQALLAAGVTQVVNVLSGGDPAQEALAFQSAVAGYAQAVADWKAAEVTNPASDAAKG